MKGYDIKIRLDNYRPLTWRDLIIPEKITFKQLHEIIQAVYGFYDGHLYSFSSRDLYYTIEDSKRSDISWDDILDSNTTYIDKYFTTLNKMDYEYDFGDGWSFTIEIKKVVDYDKNYPTLKRYKGDYNPMEDCGGVYGLSDIVYYKEHPEEEPSEHAELYMDEISKFDQELTQKLLKHIKRSDTEPSDNETSDEFNIYAPAAFNSNPDSKINDTIKEALGLIAEDKYEEAWDILDAVDEHDPEYHKVILALMILGILADN